MKIITDSATGTVLVTDDRPDGTTIVLVCKPLGSANGLIGPVIEPEGSYPVGFRAEALDNAPIVNLNTTDMPRGNLCFIVGTFLSRLALAFRRQESDVHLTPESALEWGYQPGPEPTEERTSVLAHG